MKRKFPPGSEWLYLKIYTGVKTADLLLEEAIQPLVEYLKENIYISKWFFIRYNDPKPHLRIRFLLNDTNDYNKILHKINERLKAYIESGEIYNVLIDTYNREMERYGESTIEDSETLFWLNSEFTLQCLHYDDEEKIIVSLFYIDEILSKLDLSVQEKLDWIKDFNTAFKQEFAADKKFNSQLDKKYRAFKPKYLEFIQNEAFSEERDTALFNIEECSAILRNILYHHRNRSLGISLQRFFSSIFHMNTNRLFVSDQRLFELLIYDYLLRHYKMASYQESGRF